mmetsp:Transcript_67711/g.201371  ORF Transcript_67711/g.201371 Transcript_67711/m.201371 type:complete len:338 (+) Transcript_67711:251-1264(+)
MSQGPSLAQQRRQEMLAVELYAVRVRKHLHDAHHGAHGPLRAVARLHLAVVAEAAREVVQDGRRGGVYEQQVEDGGHAGAHHLLGLLAVHRRLDRRRARRWIFAVALHAPQQELRDQEDEVRQERRVLRAPVGGARDGPDRLDVHVEALALADAAEGVPLQERGDEVVGGLKQPRQSLHDLPPDLLVLHGGPIEGPHELVDGLLLHLREVRQGVQRQAVAAHGHHLPDLRVVAHAEQAYVAVPLEQGLEGLACLLQDVGRGPAAELDACSGGVHQLGEHVHEASLGEEEGRGVRVQHVGLLPDGELRGGPVREHVEADLEAVQDVGPTVCRRVAASE